MKYKVLTAAAVLTGAYVFSVTPAQAADTFPSQDACAVTNNNMPSGNCGLFTQVLAENFNAEQYPVGRVKNCAGDGDFRCEGLAGTRYYNTIGAYPTGWPDTATSGADGNGGRTFGGYYHPEDTVSFNKSSTGDGQMRVHMFRPTAGGSNHVAAVVPRQCMNLRYGKYTERFKVSAIVDGYKMAHLRYTPNEVDYPEAGGNFKSDPVSVFTHGFKESGADVAPNSTWTDKYHTYSTEIVPGSLRFYLDGKLVRTVSADFPDAADWILQNESALAGGYAAKGSSVDIDTSWVTCYKYTGTTVKRR